MSAPRPSWLDGVLTTVEAQAPEAFTTFAPPDDATRNSAVLLLFGPTADGGTDIVLTARSRALRAHPGQVSFPGGRVQCLQSSKQITELQKEISEYRDNEEKLIKYIRDLEQKNDDLERAERVMLESVGDIEAKLNSAIERNALLENELNEKETLRTMVQRLKDEQRGK